MEHLIPNGARVEYTGAGIMLSANRLGHHGTVLSSYNKYSHTFNGTTQVVKVKWDGAPTPQSVFAPNVKVIASEPTWEL
jgi:hypothetical protein